MPGASSSTPSRRRALISDELVQKIAFCGTPAQRSQKLDWLREVGVDAVSVFPLGQDRRGHDRALRAAGLREGREDRPSPRCANASGSDCAELWDALHAHPFIRELAAGTLPPESFRFYIEQNLQYLLEYARAMAIAPRGAPGTSTTMRLFSADLANIVESRDPGEPRAAAPRPRARRRATRRLRRAWRRRTSPTRASSSRRPARAARSRSWPRSCRAPGATATSRSALLAEGLVHDHPVYAEWIRFFGEPRLRGDRRPDASGLRDGSPLATTCTLERLSSTSSRHERPPRAGLLGHGVLPRALARSAGGLARSVEAALDARLRGAAVARRSRPCVGERQR